MGAAWAPGGPDIRHRVAVLALALLAGPLARAVEVLPPEQLRPGMKGVGRTVFEGARIEEFQVEIIGTLENVLGPRQSLVLARLTGGRLAETGVIAGMSGSPVYVDGKLVGAVAYGFPFSKETIAGITPFGDMVAATQRQSPRAASARLPLRFGAHGPALPLDRESFLDALRRPRGEVTADAAAWRGPAPPPGLLGATLRPLALPLSLSGFSPEAFEWARGFFGGLGFAPVQGASGAAHLPPQPDLAPGSAVGISLLEGDIDMSVTGTVTHVDGDRVYAFGHPFYNLGPTRFPMKKAHVFSVFPSLYQSWKISAATQPVGTLDQDRTSAVSGRLGSAPELIPVEVRLRSRDGGAERRFSFRMVQDDLFSPLLAYAGVLSVLQGYERAVGAASVRVQARLGLADGREVEVDDLFSDDQPAVPAALLVAAPLAYVLNNEFERVVPVRLSIEIDTAESRRAASLQRIWVERSGPVRPGERVLAKAQLRSYRGELRTETLPVQVPASAAPGDYTLLVCDAETLNGIEQRELRQPFAPRDLDQLLKAINGLRHRHHLYARLLRPAPGVIVAGEYLPGLPPSALAVLGTRSSANLPLRSATAWELDLPTEQAVSGARSLTLTISR